MLKGDSLLALKIEKSKTIGFCFGVRRAVDTLEKVARQRGEIETLGDLVHNRQVMESLTSLGVKVVGSPSDVRGDTVVISSHGVGPKVLKEFRNRGIKIIDTTCSFVKRAQTAARKLAESGFYTIVYGDAGHAEVKGILGWAGGRGLATLDESVISGINELPRRIGILSQTTQKPNHFNAFVKVVIDAALVKDSELRVIDTICHDIRQRQADALELAGRVDMIIIIGGHKSANTKHLVELCSTVTETFLVESADEINPSWLEGKKSVGIAAGASTDDSAIDGVLKRLDHLS